MELQVSGKLTTATSVQPSFAGCRIDALFDRKPAPAPSAPSTSRPTGADLIEDATLTPIESDVDFAPDLAAAATMAPTSAEARIAPRVSALSGANGKFTLVFPDLKEIASEKVKIEVRSPIGKTIREMDLVAADLGVPIAIEVMEFGTTLDKPDAPAEPPPTRRIQGRVIERNGRPLPTTMQVLLLARERDTPDDQPLEPILVSKGDASGYFAGSVRNRSYATVVAVVSGVPGETPVQLENSLVPPRVPIVVDLSKRPDPGDSTEPGATKPDGTNGTTNDCHCHGLTVPRTPTQDNIADAPGTFSTDLGTGECVKFNVPNRAIEEFDFYSVVRTTEPDISGVVTGTVKDEPVRLPPSSVLPPAPPIGTRPPPPPGAGLAIEMAIRAALMPLVPSPVTWSVVEATVRIAIDKVGGKQLPEYFFRQFTGWGEGPTASLWRPNVLPDTEEVIKASVAYASGQQGPSPAPSPGTYHAATPVSTSYAATAGSAARNTAKIRLDIYKLKGLKPRPPRRVPLDSQTPVDWDSTPTFYEATSIAHGHLLHFKQVWYADGYSMGDLLYSLPLAPGQKKLISVVDWERRERTTREEFTSADEGLQAALSRDRDLSEVVSGALSESVRGGSKNTTVGAGVGTGAAGNGSYQQFNFGALIGVSGGIGDSTSSAFQVSSRDVSSSSLQHLRDRTLQSASAVRNLRSTIVQTASQGETVRATTEVVANHNHCHALTIQYFEVLRHLKVTNELVDVQECLFVPLPMTEFNREKTLRWRQPLSTYLQRRELAPGFDATRRVFTDWGEVDAPIGRYADEIVTAIFGELTLTIFIPLPPFPEKPAPTPENAVEVAEKVTKALMPTEGFFGAVLAIATGGASLIAGAVTGAATDAVKATTQGAQALTQSMFSLPTAEERYAKFQQEVMPPAAAGFVDQLEMYARVGSNEVKLNGADFTLVSNYQPGSPLLVSVRGQVTNPVRRSDISSIIIKCAAPLPPGCRAIVNSASLRYQTRMFRRDLVNDSRVNDDIDLPIVAFTGAPSLPIPPFPGFPGLPGFPSFSAPPLPLGFPSGYVPIPGMSPIRAGNGATLYTPLDEWEQRSPRLEDIRLSAELVEHLNVNLEYYHHAIWWTMDPNRRYMLLDGYEAPNAGGRSVASVVENTLIGIVGNSLVMPVALGNHLDPQFRLADGATLLEQYDPQSPAPPSRISLPTRGVFAEAVMGDCNACEEIDDTRFWRWDEVPIDEPPALDVAALASRRTEPVYGSATPFPTPIVGMQTPPQAPDAAGVKAALDALAKSAFTDITGLAGTQANALAAYSKAMDTALAFGKEASELAKQAAMTKNVGQTMRAIDKAEGENKIDKDDAKQMRTSALRTMAGETPSDPKASAVADRLKVIADQQASGNITPEVAAQRRAEVMKGLSPEETTKLQESEAATEAMRKIAAANIASVERRDADGTGTTIKAQPASFDPGVAAGSDDAYRWKDLLSFRPPKQLLDSIATRGLEWQRIQDAQGAVNLDVYMIEVKRLPRAPGGAATLDDTEFFEYIRKSFPRLVPTFTVIPGNSLDPYESQDGTTWQSAAPLGAVMEFSLALGPIPEFALVLCAEHDAVSPTDKHWNFVTLRGKGRAGYHPVSGTRQFGIKRFGVGGPLFFFIRAADRVTGREDDLISLKPEGWTPEMVFKGGDEYWLELLDRLRQDITLNGGEAGGILSDSRRHPWANALPYVYGSQI